MRSLTTTPGRPLVDPLLLPRSALVPGVSRPFWRLNWMNVLSPKTSMRSISGDEVSLTVPSAANIQMAGHIFDCVGVQSPSW